MVERSIAWLIGPKGRCRKLRYHAPPRTAGGWGTRITGLDQRRLLNLGLTPPAHRLDLRLTSPGPALPYTRNTPYDDSSTGKASSQSSHVL
jgi:hypothetical protein